MGGGGMIHIHIMNMKKLTTVKNECSKLKLSMCMLTSETFLDGEFLLSFRGRIILLMHGGFRIMSRSNTVKYIYGILKETCSMINEILSMMEIIGKTCHDLVYNLECYPPLIN